MPSSVEAPGDGMPATAAPRGPPAPRDQRLAEVIDGRVLVVRNHRARGRPAPAPAACHRRFRQACHRHRRVPGKGREEAGRSTGGAGCGTGAAAHCWRGSTPGARSRMPNGSPARAVPTASRRSTNCRSRACRTRQQRRRPIRVGGAWRRRLAGRVHGGSRRAAPDQRAGRRPSPASWAAGTPSAARRPPLGLKVDARRRACARRPICWRFRMSENTSVQSSRRRRNSAGQHGQRFLSPRRGRHPAGALRRQAADAAVLLLWTAQVRAGGAGAARGRVPRERKGGGTRRLGVRAGSRGPGAAGQIVQLEDAAGAERVRRQLLRVAGDGDGAGGSEAGYGVAVGARDGGAAALRARGGEGRRVVEQRRRRLRRVVARHPARNVL